MPKVSTDETILDEDGGNLVGVLHQLSQTYPEFLSELNKLLKILYTKLHPKMQVILADIIRQASRRTQIIVTTHNPDFVSMFSPEEIVILQKYNGATEMRRFSDKGALHMWLQDFTTRELWLMGELESRW
jgi:predicted ATPase